MGSRILAGRYELIDKIGEGGMAVVFKSRDRLLNRNVAIKILRPEFTKDPVFIDNFRRESQTAASLIHQNIVNIFDVGKEGNIYYIVMELIEGRSLSEIIKSESPMDPHLAVSYARQIASALSLAHSHNLIHRDVKPHNIMITNDGDAKITDFGIAKVISSDTFVGDKQENVMGSVHYFSPEQAKGGFVDAKSDIYSLGIVLYEMLTGKVPFDGETAVEVAVKHMNEPMPHPSASVPDIPQDLDDIVMKSTDKVPANRYKSMDELITALSFVKYSKTARIVAETAAAEAEESEEEADSSEGEFSFDKLFKRSKHHEDPEEESLGETAEFEALVNSVDEGSESDAEDSENQTEEDDTQVKKKKQRRPILWQRYVAVVIAVALALPVSGGIYNVFHKDEEKQAEQPVQPKPSKENTQKKKEIVLPSLEGKQFVDAKQELADLGLDIEIELELASSTYAEGQIMSQTPSEGSTVKTGALVRVRVSKGKADNKVPNLLSKKLNDAKSLLSTYGYKVGSVTEKYDKGIKAGYVISQNPEKGTVLESGGKVSLVISLGPDPNAEGALNLVDTDLELAKAFIEEQGMKLGTISYEKSNTVPKNCVIRHTPEPGAEVKKGLTVNLVVSSGGDGTAVEDPVEGDDPIGSAEGSVTLYVDFSGADSDEFLLTINIKDEAGTRSVIAQQTKNKADVGENFIITGRGTDAVVAVQLNNIVSYYTVNFSTGEVSPR